MYEGTTLAQKFIVKYLYIYRFLYMQFMVLYLYKLAFLRLHCIFFIVLFFFCGE